MATPPGRKRRTGGEVREKRHAGIDLRRWRFTCCVRPGSEKNYLSERNLERLLQFVKKLGPSDDVAEKVRRLFYEAVAPHGAWW
jgi:hypothetical protein